MVTIHHLEVRFDVDAGEEEQAFLRLFQRYVQAFARAQQEQEHRRRAAERDRALDGGEVRP
jgi:hypothetical protein